MGDGVRGTKGSETMGCKNFIANKIVESFQLHRVATTCIEMYCNVLELYKGTSPNLTAITSSSSQHSSVPESEREFGVTLSIKCVAMLLPIRRLDSADNNYSDASDHQGTQETKWRHSTA